METLTNVPVLLKHVLNDNVFNGKIKVDKLYIELYNDASQYFTCKYQIC